MKPKQRAALKDQEAALLKSLRASNRKEIDALVQEVEKRLLGEEASNSIKAVSGGRPESNRSKF